MILDERLMYCRTCTNRQMNASIGLVCGLTGAKPTFETTCPDHNLDQAEADRLVQRERAATEESKSSGMFAPEKRAIEKGVWGGIAMMAIAVVWFFAGLAAGYLFYYPPILFCIGIYAVIKGAVKK